jgi:hypothetical protein
MILTVWTIFNATVLNAISSDIFWKKVRSKCDIVVSHALGSEMDSKRNSFG